MTVKYSCKDCQNRCVGCHSTCDDYINNKKKQEYLNKKRSKYNQVRNEINALFNNRR